MGDVENEISLIRRASDGDTDAFAGIVGIYKKPIYNLCLRMLYDRGEAEDAAQKTFIKLYRSLRKFDENKKFSTWVFRIASNVCIDMIRKRKVKTVPIDDCDLPGGESPEKSYIASESRGDIRAAVRQLPEMYRQVIVYYHLMNFSYQEISDLLGEPISIIKNRLYRARLMLRKNLTDKEGGYDGLRDGIRADNETS